MAECLASGDDPGTPCCPWRSPCGCGRIEISLSIVNGFVWQTSRWKEQRERLINIAAVLERWRDYRSVRSNDTDIVDIRNYRTKNDTCQVCICAGYRKVWLSEGKQWEVKLRLTKGVWQKDSFIERLKIVEAIFNNLWSSSMLGFTSHTPAAFASVNRCYKTSASISFFVTTDVSILVAPLLLSHDRKSEAERPTNLSSPRYILQRERARGVHRDASRERYD